MEKREPCRVPLKPLLAARYTVDLPKPISAPSELVTPATARAQQEAQFVAMDANKDGKIVKAEWDAAQEKHFAARDKNKDGKWTKDEKSHAQKHDKPHDKKPHGKKNETPEKRS